MKDYRLCCVSGIYLSLQLSNMEANDAIHHVEGRRVTWQCQHQRLSKLEDYQSFHACGTDFGQTFSYTSSRGPCPPLTTQRPRASPVPPPPLSQHSPSSRPLFTCCPGDSIAAVTTLLFGWEQRWRDTVHK